MTNLSKYGRNAADKTYPDCDESVFGHMVLELGMSPEDAVQNLRPWVRDLDLTAANSKNVAYLTAFIGAGAGLATAATLGIGATAILPIAAAVYNLLIAQQSTREQSIREAEYLLLKSCPELLKLIYALSKRGLPKEALIECYDDLLNAFTVQFQQRASLGMSEELDHDIVRSFQAIVQAKIEAENLARSIVAETQDFKFETLYQSTEPTAPRVEDPVVPTIGANTRLGAIDVPSQPVSHKPTSNQPTGLSTIVADPYQSRAFFGAQRTGKTYLAAVASKEISDRLGARIYHLNLASFGDEDAYYWQHASETLQADLSAMDGYTAKQVIADAIELVKRFYSHQNAILVVDEIAYLGSTGNQHAELLKPLLTLVADKITTLASSGKKRQQAVWTIAPEFVAGSLTQDAKAVKKLELTYVTIHPNRKIDWNGQSIGFDWSLLNQIKANFAIDETSGLPNSDRICFVGRHWLPLGDLPELKKPPKPNPDVADPIQHLERSLEASSDCDDNELAIRAEIKRFLSANPEGSKARDLANKARQPVRRMPVDDIKFVLDLMTLENEVYEVDGTFFTNS